LPCICKSADVETLFFDKNDFKRLSESDKKVYLVDLRVLPDEPTREYILLGETLGIHKMFLTKMRNPWYSIEKRKPADIWVAVFNREGIKFIQNNADALNLTTFHGIYIHPQNQKYRDIIFGYLLTNLSKELFNANRREYGNGLSKYEPNDFNNSDIFDFTSLTPEETTDLQKIMNDLKTDDKNHIPVGQHIVQMDEYFRSLL
jgi:adenine-specific DNA-methyltransferase